MAVEGAALWPEVRLHETVLAKKAVVAAALLPEVRLHKYV